MSSNRLFRRNTLSAAIAASLLATGQVAIAQEQAGEAEDGMLLEEVVVTATRRSQTVQEIPFNISAITGSYIEEAGLLDATELMREVPGVIIADGGARAAETNAQVMIRGINIDPASTDRTYLSAPTVSVYINETPMYANFILRDIERVEVLRGPQATLYGSGSLGGTVRYMMNRPDPSAFEGRVYGEFGQTNGSDGYNWNADVMLNIPLGETAAFRFNVGRVDNDGVIDYVNAYVTGPAGIPIPENGDVLNGDPVYQNVEDADWVEVNFARASLAWMPNDDLDVLLSFQWQEGDFGGRRQMTTSENGYGEPYGKYEIGAVVLEPASNEAKLAALEIDYDMGFATLSSSTSWYDRGYESTTDNTGFYAAQDLWFAPAHSWLYYYGYGGFRRPAIPAYRTANESAFVQEFRLVSNSESRIDWVAGLFYMDQDGDADQVTNVLGFQPWRDASGWANDFYGESNDSFFWFYETNFKDTAVFGEVTFHASETVDITLGGRYFDNKNTVTSQTQLPIWIGSVFDCPTCSFDGPIITTEEKDSDTLWKGNISWRFNDQQMLYGTISEGYRRGGSNASPIWFPGCVRYCNDPSYDRFFSDSVVNYEIGWKGLMESVSYTISAFYIDWSDPQLNTATPEGAFYAVVNGSSATSKGIDAEVSWAITQDLILRGGYAYVDATLDEDLWVPVGNPEEPAERLEASAGNQLPGTPKHSLSFSLVHTHSMSSGLQWINRAFVYYQGESENSILDSPDWNTTLDAFSLWNFSTAIAGENWTARLYINNAFNEEGSTAVFKEGYMVSRPADFFYGQGQKTFIARPRTIGASITYWF
jgi:outer membrane receptor protein involved in Fe transport